jgi:diguanylate cyclase (GGDEF)-like protein
MHDMHPGRTALVILSALLSVVAPSLGAIDPHREITQYARQAWTVESGLPHGTVRSILQASDGYLWMATYEGLARFSGFEFELFDRTTAPGLAHNSVLVLLEARDGALWIGTNGGLTRYRDRRFESFTTADGLTHDSIYALAEAPDGALWIGTNGGGLNRFHQGRFETFAGSETLRRQFISSLAFDGDGALWIGTNGNGVFRLHDDRLESFGARDGLYDDAVMSLLAGDDGALWVGTYSGLNRIHGGRVERLGDTRGVPTEQFTALFQDRDGTIWAGTYGEGLLRITDARIARYNTAQGLLNESVRSIQEDVEGNLWIGTNGGVERFTAGKFVNWGVAEGLVSDYVRAIVESRDGRVWIGTAGGLSSLEGRTVRNFDQSTGLVADYVFSLRETRDGALWVGTPNGLSRMSGDRVTRTFTTRDGLSNNSIRALVEDAKGTLWVGTDRGLNAIRDGSIRSYTTADGLPSDFVLVMARGPDDALWVATDGGGIVRLREGSLTTFGLGESVPSLVILSLHVDDDGTVWAGTDGEGLVRIRDDRVTLFTTRDGLDRDKILQIVDDGIGNLWLGSARGISVVPRAQLEGHAAGTRARLTPVVYGRSDGLRSIQCNGASGTPVLKSRDGRLWFATTGGVAAIDPRAIQAPVPFSRPVVVEALSADGLDLPVDSGELVLPPGTRRFEVRYGALTFRSPEKVVFRHRLEGFDDAWVDAGRRRLASYSNLPPGEYRFHVTAADSEGGWSDAGASIAVTIRPLFHQTLAFRLLLAAAVVGAAFGLHRLRLGRIDAQRRVLETLVGQRTEELALANQMLHHLSVTDALTGIANRRQFDERLRADWNRAARSGALLSLLMIDIDDFKLINDTEGHQAGDEILRRLASGIAHEFRRAEDLVARYGGEEIVVILWDLQPREALDQARRVRHAVEALALPHPEGTVTVSIGVATATPRADVRPESLVRAADDALYRAKTSGRNRVEQAGQEVATTSDAP